MTARDYAVLGVLATHPHGALCTSELAHELRLSTGAVRRSLSRLQRAGKVGVTVAAGSWWSTR